MLLGWRAGARIQDNKSDSLNDGGFVATPNAGCECSSWPTLTADLKALLNILMTCQPYCSLQ